MGQESKGDGARQLLDSLHLRASNPQSNRHAIPNWAGQTLYNLPGQTLTRHRLTLDLWLVKDNRFLNPKSSYGMILVIAAH